MVIVRLLNSSANSEKDKIASPKIASPKITKTVEKVPKAVPREKNISPLSSPERKSPIKMSKQDLYRDPNKMTIAELKDFALKYELEVDHSGKGGVAIKKDFIKAYKQYTDKIKAEEAQKQRVNINVLYDTPEFLIAGYNMEMKAFWIKQVATFKRILFSTQGKEVSKDVVRFILQESDEIKSQARKYEFNIRDIEDLLIEFKQVHIGSGVEEEDNIL